MTVSLKNLRKTFADGTDAVKSIDLDIEQGEFITLLGPSGCGKTTTLRLIAGLEEPTSGEIYINGRQVNDVDPGDRDIAMVFQSYALYPHMTALQNMTLNLTVSGLSKEEANKKALETARTLGLEELLDKKPGKLSGGQRQRVALGRAMVRDPVCYLMDEPLSNLDLKLRELMRTELKRIHKKDKVTTVYVTHDQAEALILSDRVTVMKDGEIQQIGDPVEIYGNPANEFVAEFIGSPSINLIKADVVDNGIAIEGNLVSNRNFPTANGGVNLGVRPEDVILSVTESGGLKGKIEFTEPQGGVVHAFVNLDLTEKKLKNRDYLVVSMDVHESIDVGTTVGVKFREERINYFDCGTGRSLAETT
jgi:ABC-type sugar transport system ATPase subunit